MILRHRDWDSYKKINEGMTVGEFIKEIVLTDENKDKKYYKISIIETFDHKQNMIIYCQNGKIKSHHSTGAEFDYKKIIDEKIKPYYEERNTRTTDIISFTDDFETEKDTYGLSEIDRYKRQNEELQEQIKWLEYRIDNKIF